MRSDPYNATVFLHEWALGVIKRRFALEPFAGQLLGQPRLHAGWIKAVDVPLADEFFAAVAKQKLHRTAGVGEYSLRVHFPTQKPRTIAQITTQLLHFCPKICDQALRRVGNDRARTEDLGGAVLLEEIVILVRDDPADHDQDIGAAELLQLADQLW